MKKFILFVLIIALVLSAVGCTSQPASTKTEEELRAEIKAEMEAEHKEKENAEKEKIQQEEKKELSVKNDNDVFEFISTNYLEFSREDYDKWIKTYFDITGDGKDEVILSTTYGDGGLNFAIILTSEEGALREISRYIYLAKYGNDFEMKDGFLVHRARSGGTGLQTESMSLYYYGGYDLEPSYSGILISESVGAQGVSYDIKSNIEGSLDDFIITYTKEDLLKETKKVIAKDKYTFNPDNYNIWHTPLSIENTAKDFDSVYNGNNYNETLQYYNENLYFFGEDERRAFSKKLLDVINKDKEEFFNMNFGILEGCENYYNKDTNEFDLTGLDVENREIIEKIQSRGIYHIVKVFYTTEGVIEEAGFGVMLDLWAFQMLKPAYSDIIDRFDPNDFDELKPFYVPQIYLDEWTPIKAVTRTNTVYPNVYVSSMKDIYLLEGKDTWKTNVLLPVEIINKK